jgi:biopolymer transport protein ExbB/TolQ
MLTNLFLRLAYAGSEWVLWILMILSFVSIAFMVERVIYFRRNKVDGESLSSQLSEQLRTNNLRGAYQLVYNSTAIECQVVAAGLAMLKRGFSACNETMLSVKSNEKGRLDARLNALATIGSNAPFIGLLGTVLGIIKAARDLSETGGAEAVMSGVFEALVATAVGLFVAIPAIVAYNILQRKVKNTLAQVDSLAHLVLAHAPQEGHAAAGGSAPPVLQPAKV